MLRYTDSMPAAPSTAPLTDARPVVDDLLATAVRRKASDVHVEPAAEGYEIRLRMDGLLETIARHDSSAGRAIVARLMVMAQLLTYRQDIPQEGRLSTLIDGNSTPIDLRLAIIPTVHGLRAAVRLPAEMLQPRDLEDLQLPANALAGLKEFAENGTGMLILTGPAGSGKTTTIYALLRHIVQHSPGLSIVTLEDPVERSLAGVTQIEVTPFGQMTYERALRSILRQDPQVLALGEIRDTATATLAIQAALSGHRLICTFHAATLAGAISRLIEMGIEPYQITSSIYGAMALRLLRRKTPTGYGGRLPVAEFIRLDDAARAAILRRDDATTLQTIFQNQPGFVSLRQAGEQLVTTQMTDAAEVRRVLGG
jgi:general secretion pathway protein E